MATIAAGVLGPAVGWIMLIFIMVTLYDAQFPFYDTYIGRTPCDAIAVTGKTRGKPYRYWYFLIVTITVLAGFVLITIDQPLILWLGVATAAVVYRSIGSLQIIQLNNSRLHSDFRVSKLNFWLLWFSFATGMLAVGIWAVNDAIPRILGQK